jgi:hypothetical protein
VALSSTVGPGTAAGEWTRADPLRGDAAVVLSGDRASDLLDDGGEIGAWTEFSAAGISSNAVLVNER